MADRLDPRHSGPRRLDGRYRARPVRSQESGHPDHGPRTYLSPRPGDGARRQGLTAYGTWERVGSGGLVRRGWVEGAWVRRGAVAAAGAALLRLAGCSDSDSSGTGAPEPTKAAPPTVTVTVPTAPPAAAAAVLGPTGPGTAKPCDGIAIAVGAEPQPIID